MSYCIFKDFGQCQDGQAGSEAGATTEVIGSSEDGRSASVASASDLGSDMFLSIPRESADSSATLHPSSPFGVVPDNRRSPLSPDNNNTNFDLLDFDKTNVKVEKKQEKQEEDMLLIPGLDLEDEDLTSFLSFDPQISAGWVDSFTDLFEVVN